MSTECIFYIALRININPVRTTRNNRFKRVKYFIKCPVIIGFRFVYSRKVIRLASDDISYYKIEPKYYQNFNVFKQEEFDKKITKLLRENHFSEKEVLNIKIRKLH